ncbi:MAG: RdgB/HAM1 family non-canonical purine NTP pyrophosphatase [Geminicoccaceae bacterium]|nr:RdgB/HAM1 family non-canonical purine NTP pyrophosphatase [Geminicoccaceae bacterium]MCS7267765.1 RdgB/HAM1 family non-canonical purine NTP pyrophosphatase [Geminicoccaceae bacterium]MDW8124319.1 RdgB/HAM1 family non-canonical purine NTP pyrophosphatase [Geminicoccaceae bacterium]MDW8340362.1 RdgB/HAM1 family non-canonical purine NTP pyrophosphatase [Geminicoccaceae bacterium]
MSGKPRRFTGDRLLVATHNPGKLAEFRALLEPLGVRVIGAAEAGLPVPDESGATFLENARLKAVAAARASGIPALADDSGLLVYALGGAPGLATADWAGPERDFAKAMRRVREELAARFGGIEKADRRAAFVAAICLAWPDGHSECAEGRVEGEIAPEPRGERGFGYDPLFVPEGETRTFGEMLAEEKEALSHRARAMRALLARCFAPAAEEEPPPAEHGRPGPDR